MSVVAKCCQQSTSDLRLSITLSFQLVHSTMATSFFCSQLTGLTYYNDMLIRLTDCRKTSCAVKYLSIYCSYIVNILGTRPN